MHQPGHDATEIVHQLHRIIRPGQAERGQHLVDHPVVTKDHHHTVKADHHVQLHCSQNQDQKECIAPRMFRLGDHECHRIGHDQGYAGDHNAQEHRPPGSFKIIGAAEKADVVVQRQVGCQRDLPDGLRIERGGEDQSDRNHEKNHEEHQKRNHQQPLHPAAACHPGRCTA